MGPHRSPLLPRKSRIRSRSSGTPSPRWSGVPHAVHVFAHGPHGLGLAQDAGEAASWTTLARADRPVQDLADLVRSHSRPSRVVVLIRSRDGAAGAFSTSPYGRAMSFRPAGCPS